MGNRTGRKSVTRDETNLRPRSKNSKQKVPSTLLSVIILAYLVDRCSPDDEQEHVEGQEFISEWAEEQSESDDCSLAYVAQHDLIYLEKRLSPASFLHGGSFSPTRPVTLMYMNAYLNNERCTSRFTGRTDGHMCKLPPPYFPGTIEGFS